MMLMMTLSAVPYYAVDVHTQMDYVQRRVTLQSCAGPAIVVH